MKFEIAVKETFPKTVPGTILKEFVLKLRILVSPSLTHSHAISFPLYSVCIPLEELLSSITLVTFPNLSILGTFVTDQKNNLFSMLF